MDPEVCLAIIELDETGTNYRIRWGLVEGGRPTSELPTHLMNHEVKKKLTNGKHRVIYHAHTTNTIALTFVLPLDDQVYNVGETFLQIRCHHSKDKVQWRA